MKTYKHRTLRFTRDGKYFVALTLGIGFAAINTGNNLLYLVFGMMLTFIIGSGVLSDISLVGLEVSRRAPNRLFAGSPFLMGIQLRNTKKRLPSFSIEVGDLIDGQSLDKKCYFLKIPGGRAQQTSYRHVFDRRGVFKYMGFVVSTKFPFALFRKSRRVALVSEVIVFPRIYPLLPPEGRSAEGGEGLAGRLGRRGDYYALREYLEGDDPRDIHWRKSARTGKLVIRQYEEPISRRIAIFLDNYQRQEAFAPEDLTRQERSVSQAASLAVHYIKLGYVVRLITRTDSVGPGQGQSHLTKILTTLALLRFINEEKPFAAPARWSGECIFVSPAGSTMGIPKRAA